ncbi:family 16 glycoside hydrolase [Flagellimonas okinawensis]|uniref:DUF1080 domain-containing protein n=1 Tax=Flagellimonas okinawensis TaxID=3031324 RepID=A0ABT5XJQ5_9FLAO|nr:family 16 glycoside hydrolase [[Muricauda] okinawensis]MDF0706102.1 DUF1080 domain-containing protein [[Muricauda] okinawensis]
MILFRLTLLISLVFVSQINYGQSKKTIPLEAPYWTAAKGSQISFETFDGRQTMVLDGKAFARDINFSNGVLEMDVYANHKRSFAGFLFRKQDQNFEEVYMRMHKSRQVDAVQYTPTYHGESNWQLYPEHQAQVAFSSLGWNHLRVVVEHLSATVFVNGEQVLQVNNLKSGNLNGEMGIWALFGNRFSNVSITKTGEAVAKEPYPVLTLEKGIISEWDLTAAQPYSEEAIAFGNFENAKTITVTTEQSGLLPISRYLAKPTSGDFERNQEAFTVASTTIAVDQAQTRLFSFDFSDKIIVFLNGEAIFYGNNAFRSKNNQFQGHLGLSANKLPLKLKKGFNTLHCVVIDKANGWGLMGKLE